MPFPVECVHLQTYENGFRLYLEEGKWYCVYDDHGTYIFDSLSVHVVDSFMRDVLHDFYTEKLPDDDFVNQYPQQELCLF